MSNIKYQNGRLSYRKKSTGGERGREEWSLTRNRDGTVSMRSLVMTDDSNVVRDVVYTRRRDGRPIDAFIRAQFADQFLGSGYFRVQAGVMEVTADCADTGHSVQTLEIPENYFSISTHAMMVDGWIYFNYDREKDGEQARMFYNTSALLEGVGGPLGRIETCHVQMIGEEEIEVPAGNFRATRFEVDFDNPEVPASIYWVAGEDRILLKCERRELDLEYVLCSWKVEQQD